MKSRNMAAIPLTAPCNYSGIRILLQYSNNYNQAYFNGLFLHKERFGESFAYDSKGNLLSTTDLASLQDHAAYDNYNNLTEYRQAGRPADVTTRLGYGTTEQEKKQHLLKSIIAPLGMETTYTHDAHGNITGTQIKKDVLQMTTSAGYSADGNYALTQTDARGQTVTKVIDPNLGTTGSVTDPKGQTVTYTYDVLKRVTQTETIADSRSYKNQNTYAADRLTQVKHNTSNNPGEDVAYNFEYDSLGRATVVKVGTQPLSTTAYNTDGTTASVTYGNNGQVRYGYDAFKRLTDVSFDAEGGVRYHYTYGNSGEVAQVEDKALGITIRSEYDLAKTSIRPGMIVFQGSHHCGLVIMYNFGNGYEMAVFQSVSVPNLSEGNLYDRAKFMNDANAGPNITPFMRSNWDYYGTPTIMNTNRFFFDPSNKWYLWK